MKYNHGAWVGCFSVLLLVASLVAAQTAPQRLPDETRLGCTDGLDPECKGL